MVPELSRTLRQQQRMPAPGVVALLDQAAQSGVNLLQDDADKTDVINSIELGAKILGIPLHVITRRLRYGLNIFDEEDIEPQAKSLVTGRR